MSNERVKNESYQQLGGINAKWSPYTTGPMEFLDIKNLDFQTPNSLSQRWGTTTYIGATSTFPGRVTNVYEFNRLSGTSQFIVGYTGALMSHAGTGVGVTFGSAGTTFVSIVAFPHFRWNGGAGDYILTTPDSNVFWAGDQSQPLTNASGSYATLVICGQNFAGNDFDATTFENFAYLTSSTYSAKYNGSSLTKAFIPYAFGSGAMAFSGAAGQDRRFDAGNVYTVATAFLSSTGDEGPLIPVADIIVGATAAGFVCQTIVPPDIGASAIQVYVNKTGGTLYAGWGPTLTSNWFKAYYFYKSVPITGNGQTFGVGIDNDPIITNSGKVRTFGDQLALGFTVTPSATLPGSFVYAPMFPTMVEEFQNSLFFAGFTGFQSSVLFTDTGTSEALTPGNDFEVRTNDGDRLAAMKKYNQRLVIGKNNSLHELTGDNSNNFQLKQISEEYGVYNNKCAITFGDLFAFLDRKGVVQYNGSALNLLSYKIQPIVDRINQAAAVTHACMTHDKPRNQILIAVPIDGATLNNTVLAYDYFANAWTRYDNLIPEVMLQAKGALASKSVFYGGWSGQVAYFGSSFTADPHSGFTNYFKSRFVHDMGESVEKKFRKLFLNIDPPSATLNIPINFYKDYGSSIVKTQTLSIGVFQDFINYGISAKAVSFEIAQVSTNSPLKIHGFTMEERYLRKE